MGKSILFGIVLCVVLCNAKVAFKRSLILTTTEEPTNATTQDNTASNEEQSIPKIYEMLIETNVSNRYAKTLITSKVRNLNSKAQEAVFSVITPDKAFISGFVMEIGGKKYEAYVKEKEEAKQTYDNAVAAGQSAAHVAVSARDSHRFTVSVNVEPNSKATFYLTYEELLERKMDKYEIVVNVHPGQPVKNLSVTVNIMETRPLSFVKVPFLRTGNEISKNDPNVNSEADTTIVNETYATVSFHPDIARQNILAMSFGGKEKDGFNGQFVVQYDVQRDPQGGEILVNGGHFVHFFAPKDLQPLKKQVIFILDTSGSMSGTRIVQLKEAMDSILAELKPEDVFSIVDFNSEVKVWDVPQEKITYREGDNPDWYTYNEDITKKSKEVTSQVMPSSFEASPENIAHAKKVVKELQANGGTDIMSALKIGLKMILNKDKSEGHQPLIIFLTDGEPTVGEFNTAKIISTITELNSKKVPIFSLSFGDGADRDFLSKLSLKNQGFARHIYEAADSYIQLENFYKQISSPLLSNVTFRYTDKTSNVTKQNFPILFAGGELYVTGVVDDSAFQPPSVEAWGIHGPIQLVPKVYQTTGSLERLWAYLTVKQLLEQREVAEDKSGPTKEILRLALKYSFVTDVSSLVVVKPNDTAREVNTEDASKPAALEDSPDKFRSGFYPSSSFPLLMQFAKAPPLAYSGVMNVVVPSSGIQGFRRSNPSSLDSTYMVGMERTYHSTTVRPVFVTELSSLSLIPWLKGILNENGTLTLNSRVYDLGLNQTLNLAKQPCQNSLYNTSGKCTLLDDCPHIYLELTDFEKFKQYFCELDSYGGVCCPVVVP
ncbi:hypothetical protein ABEB36_002487 [Hypothenemus hampei]|uniref:Inter-alpha-trypsin inhibitor heavy chain H4-like n=1 Tax=Hypothenemus hampei TaxID=57062 RepID=A0ABD1F9L0_HYPHA